MSPGHRVLCIDSSSHRLKEIADALRRADFEVWTAQGAGDAICLAAGLHFDALAVDHASRQLQPEVWHCLAETQPELPVLVHSGAEKPAAQRCGQGAAARRPSAISEVVLALLVLLLGNPALPQPHAA